MWSEAMSNEPAASPVSVSPPRGLLADQGGAIMVMGVFMAVLLVGFMYYLIGVGETIFYRERMADAADAGAWAAAVMHARGMNAIVLINMIMAAIAAVVLAIGAVLFIIDVGIAIALALMAGVFTYPIGAPVYAILQPIRPTVNTIHQAAQRFANAVLPVLNKAATGVKWATPWIAQVKVVNVGAAYNPPVDVGIFVSKTLVEGLPVEDDECKVLEDRGIKYIEDLIGNALGNIPILSTVMGWVGGLAAKAGSAVYGGVCGSGGGTAGADVINDAASAANEAAMEAAGCNDDPPPDPMPEGCGEPLPETGGVTAPASTSTGSDGKGPKKVKDDCNLGDECFQLRSIMIGTPNYERTMRGVKIANWGRDDDTGSMYTQLANLGRGSLAQAEFYWDKGAEDGQEMRDEWMWEMNWRARLRRFRIPAGSLLGEACTEGGGFCDAVLGSADMINAVIVH
jgi:hypothetical protein